MSVAAGPLYSQINSALQIITPANVTDPIEFWLAFLLLLAILNTVLKRVSFFSDKENKNARALTALILSFFAVTAAWVSPVILYMSSTLAVTAIILVAILIVAAMAGQDVTKGNTGKLLFAIAIVVLFVGGMFSYVFVPAGSGGVNGSSGLGGIGSSAGSALGSIITAAGHNFGLLVVAVGLLLIAVWVFGKGNASPS